MLVTLILILILSVFVLFWQSSLLIAVITGSPIVYASAGAVRDCLILAQVSSGKTIIDLGCGNARTLTLAAKEFGALGIGVDKSIYCYWKSKFNVWICGQSKNIEIVRGDFREAEKQLAKSDVVYIYLLNETLAEIESWLFKSIGDETVIVSLAFSFPNYQPIDTIETQNLGRRTKIRLYNRNSKPTSH